MLPRPGRATPAFGVEAAAARGVDLASHRSTHLSQEAAFGAGAILVFDEINRQSILRRYPGLTTPILKLGDFAPLSAGIGEIMDPIDHGLPVYKATYDQITRATAGLLGVVTQEMGLGH